MIVLRIISESFWQAMDQLRGNELRTLLSLLGITIGIFCIIAVKSAVDSLEHELRMSFKKLGEDVLYISRESWTEDPGQNWWKYVKRPAPNLKDFQALDRKLSDQHQVSIAYFIGSQTLKHEKNISENVFTMAVSDNYLDVFNLQFAEGRFFSSNEMQRGMYVALLGQDVADALFPGQSPVGHSIKLKGNTYRVAGVLEKSGNSLVNIINCIHHP